ncbi:MAG: hypothetical protein GY811_17045 [Myxococcales bacterium]|nr:hypothetical protein [Myxococcales bacterium]
MFANKFLKYSTLFLASGSLCLTACGEGDAAAVDGGEEECGGVHNPCPDGGVGPRPPEVTDPEGGMVIFECIGTSAALQAGGFPAKFARNISHFTSAGGDDHVFLTPGTGNGTAGINECNFVSGDDITWPANDVSGQTHVNVGDLTISGGSNDLVISPTLTGTEAEMTDMISRLHSGPWYSAFETEFADYVTEDTVYTVSMSGSDDYPATTYTDNLYMPSAMTMTNPTGDSSMERPTGGFTEPYTVTWDSGASSNTPDGVDILSLVMLVDGTGTNIIEFCVTENDGEFVIPVEVLEEYYTEQPTGGAILVGNVAHMLGRFDDGTSDDPDRRIDFLGMWCEAFGFVITEPAL